ncbi:MAG: tetratricopeptide repeat protein [Terriglobia bacterium]
MLSSLVFIVALTQGVSSPGDVARQAQEDLKQGNYAAACQKLEKSVLASPRNPSLWFLLGLGRTKLKELDPAIEAFRKVLEIDPRYAPAYFNLGLLYGYKGDSDQALGMYRRGLKIEPSDLGGNHNYAYLLLKSQKYEEAIVPLRRLKAANKSDLSIRSSLVECLVKSGRKTDAKNEALEFLTIPGAGEKEKFGLAGVIFENGDLDTAQLILENLVISSPESAEFRGKLGLILFKKDELERAARELRIAVHLAPDSAEYAIGYAEVLLLWGQAPTALQFLTEVKDRFGTMPEYQYKLALAYYGLNEYPKAISVLEELGRQHPEYDLVQFFLGNSYMAAGDLEQAEIRYRKAIELNPGRSGNYPPLAQLLRKRGGGSIDEAITFLQTAMKLDPNDIQTKLELALCYEGKRRFAESQALLEQVTRTQPEHYQAHVALARVYYRQGKKQEGDSERAIVTRIETAKQGEQSKVRQSLPSTSR